MKRFAWGISSAVLSLGLSASGSTQETAEWLEIRTPNFVVVSDAGRSKAWTVADEFERIRRVFLTALANDDTGPRQSLVIFAVKNAQGFRELLPGLGEFLPVGAFRQAPDGDRIVLRLDETGDNPFQTVYHEYHHVLMRESVDDAPSWVVEGLAEFWSQAVIGLEVVELGNPHRGHLRFLQNEPMMPLEELLRVQGFRHDAPPRAIRTLYAQSWALTHWLMLADGTGTGQAKLDRYLERVTSGSDPVEAFEEIFGAIEDVELELKSYLKQSMFPAMRVATPEEPTEEFAIRPLTPSESAAARSEFLVAGGASDAVRRVLEEADTSEPEASEVERLGVLAYESEDLERAAKWFGQALRDGSATYLTHYYLAMLAKERGESASVGEHLERSIELNESFAPALIELALHLSRDPNQRERVSDIATRALALAPDDRVSLVRLARTFLEMGRPGEAKGVLERLKALTPAPGSKAIERALEEDIDRHEAQHR